MGYNSINGLLLRKLMIAGANELNNNKQLVDSLNVFPVPDGDTGTNMSLTMLSAAREVEKSASIKTGDVAKLAANGSLRGARGNSGVILSQLIRGFSKAVAEDGEVNTKKLAQAAKRGVETAYKAVMKPKEGTILTVARAIADSAAIVCEETDDIEIFLKRVIEDGKKMLERTPDMLPVLKAA
ncbi:MAG: DAK2 domain-containing protein, partial [Firmicutes bacterium]|nr:DAK2 domain-containing protein [Bacillota bacterium]